MKGRILLAVFMCLIGQSFAQVQPQWTRTINNLPDSAYLFPVKVLNDLNNNVIVLSSYALNSGAGNKIVLRKYDYNGVLLWNLVYDNSGIGSPRGFDMVIDSTGNTYIAGGFMNSPYKPLIMKVNSAGTFLWMRDSTVAPINSNFTQLFFNNGRLYAGSASGVAVFSVNGLENWSLNISVSVMTVDHYGQAIISGYSGSDNLIRYDINGNSNLSDSTIVARRICVDSHNNIYLLNDMGNYFLVKYDSAGTFAWQKDSLPPAPPFGDGGFEVLTDEFDNVILAGINDMIYKYSPDGTLKWIRSMNGMDSYIMSAKMVYNLLLIAGTTDVGGQYDVRVGLFNSYGFENWSGTYNSNSQQEFSVDAVMDNSGIYLLEDSISNSTLIKFETPFFGSVPVDYSLVCVDSVWYDPVNPQLINVTVFNGDLIHMNYPSVMIISPSGDTISNKYNLVNFFAHLGNEPQTYTDTISVQGITDFTGYTFVMSEGFGVSSSVIQWCSTLSIDENGLNKFVIYPNPFAEQITVNTGSSETVRIELYDVFGKLVLTQNLSSNDRTIDLSVLSPGTYVMKAQNFKSQVLLKVK